jgi:tRNA A-37 threonylcarbamoyl transferase component Bud32
METERGSIGAPEDTGRADALPIGLGVHVPHPQPGVKVIRSAPGVDAAAWAGAIRAFDLDAARTLKSDGDTAVYRARVLGGDVVLKRWTLRTRADRAKAMLAASRGHRHWRGAMRLQNAGIPTARCIALALEQGHPPRVWLVMEQLEGCTLLEHMARPDEDVRAQHAIATAAGALVARLCRAGLSNRDLKPSNIVVSAGSGPALTVIDCVAIRRSRSLRRRDSMLAALVLEPLGCGALPRRALLMRGLAAVQGPAPLKRRWVRVAARVAAHGDPRPKINPLAPPAAANP